jgi:hypothetical protein
VTMKAATIAYRVFRRMLESGHPPDDWSQLLDEARAEGQRLQRFAAGVSAVRLWLMRETTLSGAGESDVQYVSAKDT